MPRTARQSTVQVLGALLALGVIVLLVWTTTTAAFIGQTDNQNSFASGNVELSDNDLGSAQFAVVDMPPGYSDESCIEVTYNGTLSTPDITPVRFFAVTTDNVGTITNDLNVLVQRGSGAAGFGDCSGFTSVETIYDGPAAALPGDFASGVGTWQPTATGDSASYRFVVTFAADPAETSAGGDAEVDFFWRIESQ